MLAIIKYIQAFILDNRSTKDQLIYLQQLKRNLELLEDTIQTRLRLEEHNKCIENRDIPKEPTRTPPPPWGYGNTY